MVAPRAGEGRAERVPSTGNFITLYGKAIVKKLDFGYRHPVTILSKTSEPKNSTALSGAERQRRYRLSRAMISTDISGTTAALLEVLRGETGWPNDRLIVEALKAFQVKEHRASKIRKFRLPKGGDTVQSNANSKEKPGVGHANKPSPGDRRTHEAQQKLTTKKPEKPKDGAPVQADLFGG